MVVLRFAFFRKRGTKCNANASGESSRGEVKMCLGPSGGTGAGRGSVWQSWLGTPTSRSSRSLEPSRLWVLGEPF